MSAADLIDRLAGELTPVAPGAGVRRLTLGLALGVAASAGLMLAWLGPRPDMAAAAGTPMVWVKFAYAAALGGIATLAVRRLGRPAMGGARTLLALLEPVGLLAALALVQLVLTPAAGRPALWLGHSAVVCPWYILSLSLPVFAGAVWGLRGLAPTRLRLTGFAAGLCAGGLAAFVYAFHCDESGAPFIALWYGAGVLAAAALGALAGPRRLRW